ncbi:MAG TPA: hypothetical protein VJ598_00645 [Albitalea sp.]|nr:hypothetical protein [Albitalea sp.]
MASDSGHLGAIGYEAADPSLRAPPWDEAMQGPPDPRTWTMKSTRSGARPSVNGGWRPLRVALRLPVWLGIVSLTVVALLLAFHQVVRGGVQQGEMRRMAVATQAEALWRCKALRGAVLRESCLAQLNAATDIDTTLRAEKLAPVAQISR